MNVELLPLVMRWLHILSAIVSVGGVFFIFFVLRPVANAVLQPEVHAELRNALTRRWQKFVHAAILLFLISGFYNYLAVTRFQHVDQPVYHMVFGLKFLLALVVFGLAVALTSLKEWSAKMRSNPVWLGILVLLAILVVLMSGYLRRLPTTTAVESATGPITTVTDTPQ